MSEKNVTREHTVANAHACNGAVHVVVADALTIEESRKLRHAIEAAEQKAAMQSAEIESNVHPLFVGLRDLLSDAAKSFEEGPDDAA
ncbi:hypothetical protein [Leucobacter musarum]|uniref:hypothetical protein n=1 Tax=Leucobacter musarum TaxID=1930747 RepID=UPI0006A7F0BC|nr:hypothetical protein [Leucobacter musarum]